MFEATQTVTRPIPRAVFNARLRSQGLMIFPLREQFAYQLVRLSERIAQLGEIKCQTMKLSAAVRTIKVQSLASREARVARGSRSNKVLRRDRNRVRNPREAVPLNSIQKLDNKATRTNNYLKKSPPTPMVGFSYH
jgi:hypothetical protein